MSKKLITVNENDEIIGLDTRENCHSGYGILHRAITIFIFNEKNEILLTRRSSLKKLWPGFWDTSCSTHVRQNESYEQAGERRLPEELGFTCKLKFILKFQYQANFNNIGSENEICALLTGQYSGEIKPNTEEMSEYRWITMAELEKEMNSQNEYSPWLKIAFEKYSEYLDNKSK